MATVVVIDVPADLSPAVTEEALAGCRNALGSDRCIDPEEARRNAFSDWYAIIRSEETEAGPLRIEFRRGTSTGELVARRNLSFSERDPAGSRWVSAGL